MIETVQTAKDGPVGVLTLNDPDRQNRLDDGMLVDVDHALKELLGDSNLRVLILRAAGPVFCSGMDLSAAAAAEASKSVEAAIRRYSSILRTLFNAPVPVLCVLDGPVRAGGVGLVAACDIVVASERATMELSEVRFGLLPANVLPYLIGWRMSPREARYLALTAKRMTAVEAQRRGLIDEVATGDRTALEKQVRSCVKGLLRSSPQALDAVKRYTAAWSGLPKEETLEQAIDLLRSLVTDESVRSHIQAFEEGELPPWFTSFKPSIPMAIPMESPANSTESPANSTESPTNPSE